MSRRRYRSAGGADFQAAASSTRNSYWCGIEKDYGFPEALADSERGQEGAIAKRPDRVYELGGRSRAWVKFRVNKIPVIGRYFPAGHNFDSTIVGYCAGDELRYVAPLRNSFVLGRERRSSSGLPASRSWRCCGRPENRLPAPILLLFAVIPRR